MTGQTAPRDRIIAISGFALDILMPMHLWIGMAGQIIRAGPTLQKLAQQRDFAGKSLFDVIELRRPVVTPSLSSILTLQGQKLTVSLRSAPDLPMRGVLTALPAGEGAVLNLSLGLSFADAVIARDLTLTDFSPCDQTIDLLYLREANAAIARESRALTKRLQAAKSKAETQALTDTLTGLSNRRAMDAALAAMTADRGSRFGLMHLDLDLFKVVNDTLGHAAGDHVLTHVAEILCTEIRRGDIVARVGGDEFVLLFRDCDDVMLLDAIARRLIAQLEKPTHFEGRICQISASIGTTISTNYLVPTADKMLNDADIALYSSKRNGRARHTFFSAALEGQRVRH
jgi:diguanylate cyclase (GGDEF)-like protein